jgi:hypothetical protein
VSFSSLLVTFPSDFQQPVFKQPQLKHAIYKCLLRFSASLRPTDESGKAGERTALASTLLLPRFSSRVAKT